MILALFFIYHLDMKFPAFPEATISTQQKSHIFEKVPQLNIQYQEIIYV